MTVQKIVKMSTKKWAVCSLPPRILGTADRTLVIRWTRKRSVRTGPKQRNPPQEAGDKYSRTVNSWLPVERSYCPASWQIVRAEQELLARKQVIAFWNCECEITRCSRALQVEGC